MNAKDERFRAIYTKYVQLLRIIARKRNIPEADIEDLVQETFTAYYSHYPLTEFGSPGEMVQIGRASCRERVCEYV